MQAPIFTLSDAWGIIPGVLFLAFVLYAIVKEIAGFMRHVRFANYLNRKELHAQAWEIARLRMERNECNIRTSTMRRNLPANKQPARWE